jgi:peptidoglycan/LPS O-acetylase OafA/YrhL
MMMFARFKPLRPDSDKMLHLDLLRFVASFGIVYHHSHEFFYSVQTRPAAIAASHGLALFVDLFFVISGFVIAFVYGHRVGSPREFGRFMQRRVARLWPLHLATLAAAILLSLLLGMAQISMNHPPALTARCVAGTAFLLHSVYDCGGIVFNGVSWSISTEMTMYLAFPLLALILPKRGGVTVAIAVALLAFVMFRGGQGQSVQDWTEVFPPLRALPSFMFGMGLFYARDRLPVIRFAPALFSVAVVALIVSMMTGVATFVVMPLVYLVVLCGVLADKAGSVSPAVKKSAALGQLTYSAYMTHYLIIMVMLNGVGDKLLHLSGLAILPLTLFTYAVILAVSYLSYQYFETPARRWIDRLS